MTAEPIGAEPVLEGEILPTGTGSTVALVHPAGPDPVKGEEGRTVVVGYGEHEDSCPVRCWLAWTEASGIVDGPAFREVDQWGHLGSARLTPDSCSRIITRISKRARLDVRHTGHSQRVGLITAGTKAQARVQAP
ncbi:hypothetical protein BOQ63_001485 (plasmid) [Streptomyces viridifaciens]|nr:hypothetical protein BOQ63_001485 [Streptomyces viridifaciens]